MKYIVSLFIWMIVFTTSFDCFSQVDFNNYKPLVSEGKMPLDFSMETYVKIKEELSEGKENMSKQEAEQFLKEIHYGIYHVLHSGRVIYGDQMTKFRNYI